MAVRTDGRTLRTSARCLDKPYYFSARVCRDVGRPRGLLYPLWTRRVRVMRLNALSTADVDVLASLAPSSLRVSRQTSAPAETQLTLGYFFEVMLFCLSKIRPVPAMNLLQTTVVVHYMKF